MPAEFLSTILGDPLRKFAVVLAVTALVASAGAGASAASSRKGEPSRAVLGEFSDPFREDGFRHGTDTSCSSDGDRRTCLPSGASQNVLPDGRVLYWNAIEGSEDVRGPVGFEGHRRAGDARSRLLTVARDRHSWTTPANETGFFGNAAEKPLVDGLKVEENGDTPNDGSLFCADNTFLPNGDVLTVGGTDYYAEPGIHPAGQPSVGLLELEGLKSARSFTANGDTWQPEAPMKFGRWYPSLTTLADGSVLASSGVTKLLKPAYAPDGRYRPQDNGRNVAQSEIFDAATRTWTVNPETADRSLPLYPRMHLLPNGHVYYDAAGQAFNPAGQGYDEALWNQAAAYDPAGQKWTELGVPGLTTGGDRTPDFGFRGSTFSQMLNLRAPYTTASFLSAGGVVGTSPGSYVPVASARINRWSAGGDNLTPLSPADQRLETFAAGKLAGPRWYGSGVTLPDGSVVVLSGGDLDHVVAPGTEAPITRVERYVPGPDDARGRPTGTWHVLAEAKRGRTYHNAATLLPDGRILVGGHDPIPTLYGPQNDSLARSEEEPDASFEVFSPPYLFTTDGGVARRPIIAGVGDVVLGGPLPIRTSSDVAKVVLVRNPSVTHLVDGDQRNVELEFTRTSVGVTAAVPAAPGVLPPGPYLLFVLNHAGTPSLATQVLVDAPAAGPAAASSGDAGGTSAGTASSDRPSRSGAGASDVAALGSAGPEAAVAVAPPLAGVPASSRRELPAPVTSAAAVAAGLALVSVAMRARRVAAAVRRR